MTYLGASAVTLATDRNTWHTRADQAYGSARIWNTPPSFEADSTMWHGRADQAWGSSRSWNSGSSFETDLANKTSQYNALLAGLNSPDGLVQQAINVSWGSGAPANSATVTLNLTRAGHWMIGISAVVSCSPTQNNSYVIAHVGGAVTDNYQNNVDTGSADFRYGYVNPHIDVGGLTTVTIYFEGFVAAGSAVGTMYAHFIPNATYHN